MRNHKHTYIISSERAYSRNDEYWNEICTDKELKLGDYIIMDGLKWYVDAIVK